MIRPSVFLSNPETSKTNEFQITTHGDNAGLTALAQEEFDGVVERLRGAGVDVVVVDDTAEPLTPDAVFPNNWLTTHSDGSCVMYPMQPVSRRNERRVDIIRALSTRHHYAVRHIIDWSDFEHGDVYLEGTGSLVLDRIHKIAYACLSARTHPQAVDHFCAQFGYTAVTFAAVGPSGMPLYHTNVMMCVGARFAVVCAAAITDAKQRKIVLERLEEHREVVQISMAQMAQFAGNMLELSNAQNEAVLVMSRRAYAALDDRQRHTLGAYARLVECPVENIENASGGSVRCMLAELYLPSR